MFPWEIKILSGLFQAILEIWEGGVGAAIVSFIS